MLQSYDLIIKGGDVASHHGVAAADIGVKEGRIQAIGDLANATAENVFEAKGLTTIPGVIDPSVRFREPGGDHLEDMESGSRAAVLGGVTAIFDRSDTRPAVTTAEALKDKIIRARNSIWCDYAFFIGGVPENTPALRWMEKTPGVCGVEAYLKNNSNDMGLLRAEDLYAMLKNGSRRITVHLADTEGGIQNTRQIIDLALKAGRRVHLSSASLVDQLSFLAAYKHICSLEVSPQHLSFALPEDKDQLGTRSLVEPALASERHRSALWQAVNDGLIDCLGSAHAPQGLSLETIDHPGVSAVQTLLPVMLTHVSEGRLSLTRLVDLTSTSVHRTFGLRDKGVLAVGYHADLAIVDLKESWQIDDKWIASKTGWTPYNGFKATGRVKATFVRGQLAMREGEMGVKTNTAPIRFQDTVKPDHHEREL